MTWLTAMEDKLEELIGVIFRKQGQGAPHPAELASLMWKEVLKQRRSGREGTYVPNYFLFSFHPLEATPPAYAVGKVAKQLADDLAREVREYSFLLLAYPRVDWEASPVVPRGQLKLAADFRPEAPDREQRLLVRSGSQQGQIFPLQREKIVLGRSSACDCVLRDPNVSRRHALLERCHGLCYLTDLDSTNGVLVNEQRVRGPAWLVNGDAVTLGNTVLEFQVV